MKTSKLISRIATFFAIAAFILIAISASTTYLILTTFSQGAPAEYVSLYILNSIVPYLAIAILSVIVAVLTREDEEEQTEDILPPVDEQNLEDKV